MRIAKFFAAQQRVNKIAPNFKRDRGLRLALLRSGGSYAAPSSGDLVWTVADRSCQWCRPGYVADISLRRFGSACAQCAHAVGNRHRGRPVGDRLHPYTANEALLIGDEWVLLTIAFEFLAGFYLFGSSWQALLAQYDVSRGQMWELVLVTMLIAPVTAAFGHHLIGRHRVISSTQQVRFRR
jgi:hypothetical protein